MRSGRTAGFSTRCRCADPDAADVGRVSGLAPGTPTALDGPNVFVCEDAGSEGTGRHGITLTGRD